MQDGASTPLWFTCSWSIPNSGCVATTGELPNLDLRFHSHNDPCTHACHSHNYYYMHNDCCYLTCIYASEMHVLTSIYIMNSVTINFAAQKSYTKHRLSIFKNPGRWTVKGHLLNTCLCISTTNQQSPNSISMEIQLLVIKPGAQFNQLGDGLQRRGYTLASAK